MPPHAKPLKCFAIAAPGLEPLVASELQSLGIQAAAEPGGAAWEGPAADVARANLWLRSATRVLVRVATFRARTFHELERYAGRVDWEGFVRPGSRAEFHVTCRKSALYHSDAVAQRLAESISRAGAAAATVADDSVHTDAQLFVVRLYHDECTISADSSGPLLHLRGYRQASGKAPVRETLAAATLIGAGWSGDTPLDDPFCGSGTIPIEAAMLARRMAPGLRRSFAFLNWPGFDPGSWDRERARAEEQVLPRSPAPIVGSDRDAGAVTAARENAARAAVDRDIEFELRAISDLPPAPAPGLIATNPPYGARVGDPDRLRNLYARFGDVVRRTRPGWNVAMLVADRQLERQTKLPFATTFRTTNGGIPVELMTAEVPKTRNQAPG